MTLWGFALVLSAAFCHATWNYFVKRINGGPELVWLFSALSVIIYLPLAFVILFYEKPSFDTLEISFVIGSSVLHLGYFLLLQAGYRRGDLSLVYPTARATGPFLSTAFAVWFLGETMSIQSAVGAVIVIVSIVFLTGAFDKQAKHHTTSLLFGISAGILIGSYTVWDAYAVSTLLIPPLLLDYASSLGRSILLAPIAAKKINLLKVHWHKHRMDVILIAIFNPLAYILVLYALTFTPVTYVAPLRETSVLLTVLAGSLLLGEGYLKQRLSWAGIILLGVVLLISA